MNKEQYKTYLRQRLDEAKLEYQGDPFDADKLFRTGGYLDPKSPLAPKESSYEDRLSTGNVARSRPAPSAGGFIDPDIANYTRDGSPEFGPHAAYYSSHEVHFLNPKTGEQDLEPTSVRISSHREYGALNIEIHKTDSSVGNYQKEGHQSLLHTYILPDGESKLNLELMAGPTTGPYVGHLQRRDPVLSISDANRVIYDHMASEIQHPAMLSTSTVAEAHGVRL